MEQRLSVIGLGKLGCTMLACFAHKGWSVVGVDINEDFVDRINDGDSPIYEPGVGALVRGNHKRIKATTDFSEAVRETGISFVIVPTPSNSEGGFSTEYVESAFRSMAPALSEKDSYHLIIITSTVLPGDSRRLIGLLEDLTGKKCGEDFGLCYNPDFIALGTVVHDFLNPDMVLVGESDEKAGEVLEDIHKRLTDNSPSIHRMSLENAELAKIGLNAYITSKISFSNSIVEVCERMRGGNAVQVLKAIGSDKRVGNHYFKPGLGFSGPCFPRDNRAFNVAAKNFGVTQTLADTVDSINDYQKRQRIPNLIAELLNERASGTLSILGLSYKPDVPIVDESPAISVIRELAKTSRRIHVYDPAAMKDAERVLFGIGGIMYAQNIHGCLRGTSVCFVATPWQEFKDLDLTLFRSEMKNTPAIVDAWGIYSGQKIPDGIEYIRTGISRNALI